MQPEIAPMQKFSPTNTLIYVGVFLVVSACSQEPQQDTAAGDAGAAGAPLSGVVAIDGSSTVYPISEAVAEEFRTEAPEVRATVGVSGTGGGFSKFIAGEIDINNASRPIKDSEKADALANGIEFL